jgi:hypothetical protein
VPGHRSQHRQGKNGHVTTGLIGSALPQTFKILLLHNLKFKTTALLRIRTIFPKQAFAILIK